MPTICPTITATTIEDYNQQIDQVKNFAKQIHIDLMDGRLAPTISPPLDNIWLPDGITSDIHLMYLNPNQALAKLLSLKPNMVIIHFEAQIDHQSFAGQLKDAGIKSGLALLQDTTVATASHLLSYFDQLLIFSGHLGYHGGQADLSQLKKVAEARAISPEIAIAWDGGINDQNVSELIAAGVDVFNVGSFIQSASDPKVAYDKILSSVR